MGMLGERVWIAEHEPARPTPKRSTTAERELDLN